MEDIVLHFSSTRITTKWQDHRDRDYHFVSICSTQGFEKKRTTRKPLQLWKGVMQLRLIDNSPQVDYIPRLFSDTVRHGRSVDKRAIHGFGFIRKLIVQVKACLTLQFWHVTSALTCYRAVRLAKAKSGLKPRPKSCWCGHLDEALVCCMARDPVLSVHTI